jgi:hypothetical protein
MCILHFYNIIYTNQIVISAKKYQSLLNAMQPYTYNSIVLFIQTKLPNCNFSGKKKKKV